MSAFNRREHCKRIAHLGGKACAAKHDMSERGRRGFKATYNKYFDDYGACVAFIQGKGKMGDRPGYVNPKPVRMPPGETCGRITIAEG